MPKIGVLTRICIISFVSFFIAGLTAFAADGGTILPSTEKGISDCKALINDMNNDQEKYVEIFEKNEDQTTIGEVLACGIKTGSIRLWMVPYYIRYILEFIVGIAGLISVGGIVYGGYLYLFAGLSDAKDKGKNAILYGVVGLIMTLVAWAVVNIVIAVVTG